MRGRNRTGDFRNGTPVTLPKNFGNVVNWTPSPTAFATSINVAPSPANFGNPVTSAPSPAAFNNSVGGTPVTPTFSPVAGSYRGFQVVHVISAGADAIYFTTDGTTPTTASTLYVGGVLVPSSMTVQAIAVINGASSAVGSAAYVIT